MVMVRIVPTSPGTILSEVTAGRIVARMLADLEQRLRGLRQRALVLQRGLRELLERAQRRTRRDRIGGVGRDQHRRPIAAPHRALEAARDFHAEQHLARRQQLVEFLLVST